MYVSGNILWNVQCTQKSAREVQRDCHYYLSLDNNERDIPCVVMR